MESVNQQIASNASEQGMSAAPQRKGGFVQGAAVAQACCGESSTDSSGCCGAPVQAAASAATVQPSAQIGCCGTTATTPASGSCCS
jgi:hypothetical protein